MIFSNQRFLKKQVFEITESGLKVSRKTLFDSIEYEMSFEKINNKLRIQTSINQGFLITSFFFIAIAGIILASGNERIAAIFFAISLLMVVTAFAVVLKTVSIDCYDGDKLQLYFTKYNKVRVVEFANQIISSSNKYFLTKYSKIDKDLPVEPQLNNLEFLRNKEIINEDLYESLKNQLLGRENKSSIGFNK